MAANQSIKRSTFRWSAVQYGGGLLQTSAHDSAMAGSQSTLRRQKLRLHLRLRSSAMVGLVAGLVTAHVPSSPSPLTTDHGRSTNHRLSNSAAQPLHSGIFRTHSRPHPAAIRIVN